MTILSITIGHFIVREAKTFDIPQEHAAWWETVMVQPGRYPLELKPDRNGQGYLSVRLPGTVAGSYYGAASCEREKGRIGNPSQTYLQPYEHVVAYDVLKACGDYELVDGVEAYLHLFNSYGGRRIKTAILKRDGERIQAR